MTLDLSWSNSSILISILSLFHNVGAAHKNHRPKMTAKALLISESYDDQGRDGTPSDCLKAAAVSTRAGVLKLKSPHINIQQLL